MREGTGGSCGGTPHTIESTRNGMATSAAKAMRAVRTKKVALRGDFGNGDRGTHETATSGWNSDDELTQNECLVTSG